MAMVSLSFTKVVKLANDRENQPKHYDPFYYKGSSKISSLLGPTPKSEEEVLANRLENGFSNNIIPNSFSKHQKLFPKVVKSTTTKSEKHFKPKINSKISEKKITRIAYDQRNYYPTNLSTPSPIQVGFQLHVGGKAKSFSNSKDNNNSGYVLLDYSSPGRPEIVKSLDSLPDDAITTTKIIVASNIPSTNIGEMELKDKNRL